MKMNQNANTMTPQQKYMLEVANSNWVFVPAHLVKKLRKYPNDYRKRLSEMAKKGWVVRTGTLDRFATWEITKAGKKALKQITK